MNNLYIFAAIWLTGTVAFFCHELWYYFMHPVAWKHRQEGLVTMPDWQVWSAMIFWPLVFSIAIAFAAVVYISTNVAVLFGGWRRNIKRKV